MTRRQKQVFDAIVRYWSEHGRSPQPIYSTLIAAGAGPWCGQLVRDLTALEERGKIRVLRRSGRRVAIIPYLAAIPHQRAARGAREPVYEAIP